MGLERMIEAVSKLMDSPLNLLAVALTLGAALLARSLFNRMNRLQQDLHCMRRQLDAAGSRIAALENKGQAAAMAVESPQPSVVQPDVPDSDALPDNLLDRLELPEQQSIPEMAAAGRAGPVTPSAADAMPPHSTESEVAAAAPKPSWLARVLAGGNPLVKAGVVLLFLGLSFLLRYVSERSQLPVGVRYLGVAAAGVGLLVIGWRLRKRPDGYGLIVQGAGIAVLYLTTLAAMKLHPLLLPTTGFALLVAVAVLAVWLALKQDSQVLALAAALGGFAAPVLASTGSANHLLLFMYLLVLNLGVLAVAWFRAWRWLNLAGFLCSIVLAAAWGRRYYEPSLFALAEPFLLLLFVAYVLAAFLFARRCVAEGVDGRALGYVDASLVFAVPLSVFGLQYLMTRSYVYGPALSALGFALVYAVLAWLLFGRRGDRRYALLAEAMSVLALVFAGLAVPLAFDGDLTSAIWAMQALGVYWMGLRQQQGYQRLLALCLILGAAVCFLADLRWQPPAGVNTVLLQGSWLSGGLLALVCVLTGWLMRQAGDVLGAIERRLQPCITWLAWLLLTVLPFMWLPVLQACACLAVLGLVMVCIAALTGSRALQLTGVLLQLLAGLVFIKVSADLQVTFALLAGVSLVISLCGFTSSWRMPALSMTALVWATGWWLYGGMWLFELWLDTPAGRTMAWLAWVLVTVQLWRVLAQRLHWPAAERATLALLPALLLVAVGQWLSTGEVHHLTGWGWLLWPLALGTHLMVLRDLSGRAWESAAHVAGCWLFLGLVTLDTQYWAGQWGGRDSVWALLGWVVPALVFLLHLGSRTIARDWPYGTHLDLYRRVAAQPVAALSLLWVWMASLRGDAVGGLPYLPLLNPLELGQLAVLASLLCGGIQQFWMPRLQLVTAVSAWIAVSSLVLRTCHYWAGVEWSLEALQASLLAQSALSIVWSLLAISLMLLGHRKRVRQLWLSGAALQALVVLKLFLVELAASGSLERIISFLAVGGLLMLVGYFAPLPPKAAVETD